MSINVTTGQIKVLIKNIRNSFVRDNAPKLAVNLEQAAQAFGFQNWDTLSGVASKEDVSSVHRTEPLFVSGDEPFTYFEMYALGTDDEDEGDPNSVAPRWLKLKLTNELVARIRRLQSLVQRECLTYVKTEFADFCYDGRVDVDCRRLAVGKNWFWVEGTYGTDGEFEFETHVGQIPDMTKKLEVWKQRGTTYPMVLSNVAEVGDSQFAERSTLNKLVKEGLLPSEAIEDCTV
jgi:hypothetical protein